MALSELDKQLITKMAQDGVPQDQVMDKLREVKGAALEETSPTVSNMLQLKTAAEPTQEVAQVETAEKATAEVSPVVSQTLGLAAEAKKAEPRLKKVQEQKALLEGATKNVGDFVATAGATGVSEVGKGLGSLIGATDAINPVSHLAKAMGVGDQSFGAQTQKGVDFISEAPLQVQEKLGTTDSTAGKAGAVTGKILGTVAKQVPGLVGGSELLTGIKALPGFQQLASKTPQAAAKLLDFVAKSVGSTELITVAEEDRFASPAEVGAYGALDAMLFGVGKMGKSLYKAAFKGTKTQEKNLIKAYDKTIADVAEELGFVGGAETIEKSAKGELKTIFGEIKTLADTNKPVTRKQFLDEVLPTILKKFDNLPESQVKSDLIEGVTKIVEDHAPIKSATGAELIKSIENLNQGLFGEGNRIVLNPKQLKSVEADLKTGIKELLPDDIKPLYQKYAKTKLIEQIMADSRVKQLVGRSLVGGATGGISGASAGVATDQGPLNIIGNTIAGAIIGALGGRATGSVGLKTVGGKFLEKAPTASELSKIVISEIFSEDEARD